MPAEFAILDPAGNPRLHQIENVHQIACAPQLGIVVGRQHARKHFTLDAFDGFRQQSVTEQLGGALRPADLFR